MAFQKVASLDEVPAGRTKFVCAGNRQIVLANWQGRVYALHGVCPHQGFPLEGAALWDNLIECPYHHFQYKVESGENYYPSNVYPQDYPELQKQLRPLRTYPVEVRDTEVWVDLE